MSLCPGGILDELDATAFTETSSPVDRLDIELATGDFERDLSLGLGAATRGSQGDVAEG